MTSTSAHGRPLAKPKGRAWAWPRPPPKTVADRRGGTLAIISPRLTGRPQFYKYLPVVVSHGPTVKLGCFL